MSVATADDVHDRADALKTERIKARVLLKVLGAIVVLVCTNIGTFYAGRTGSITKDDLVAAIKPFDDRLARLEGKENENAITRAELSALRTTVTSELFPRMAKLDQRMQDIGEAVAEMRGILRERKP